MELLNDAQVWYLLSFLVFVVIAFRFGKSSFLNTIDSRIAEIQKEISTAESLRVEAQEMLAQYQRKQRDALQDAEKIINDAKEQAKEAQKQAEQSLKESMKRREAQLQDRLKRMEQNAIQEIQSHAADLAINAAKEIITETLDKKAGEKLVDQSIKNVANNIH